MRRELSGVMEVVDRRCWRRDLWVDWGRVWELRMVGLRFDFGSGEVRSRLAREEGRGILGLVVVGLEVIAGDQFCALLLNRKEF